MVDGRQYEVTPMLATKSISKADSSFLDFARGISAQLVLFGHLLSKYGFYVAYPFLPKVQNFGVIIFFIMSGFLITFMSIVKGRNYGFINFMVDRFSRIYCALIPAFALIFFIDLYLSTRQIGDHYLFDKSFGNFVFNLFLLQNHPVLIYWFHATSFGSGRVLWTVSIEWMFYICFGLLFYWGSVMKKLSPIKIFFALFFLVVPIFYISARGDGLTFYWLMGLVLALLYFNSVKIFNEKYLISFLFVVLISFVYRLFFSKIVDMYDVGLALIICILFYIIFSLNSLETSITRYIFNRTKTWNSFIASYSYSLYLLHYSLIYLFFSLFKNFNLIVAIFLNIVIINLLSFAFYYIFERNYTKVKVRIKHILELVNVVKI